MILPGADTALSGCVCRQRCHGSREGRHGQRAAAELPLSCPRGQEPRANSSQPQGCCSKPGSAPGPAAPPQARAPAAAGGDAGRQARLGRAAGCPGGGEGHWGSSTLACEHCGTRACCSPCAGGRPGSHRVLLPPEGVTGGAGAGGLAGVHGPGAPAGCPAAAQVELGDWGEVRGAGGLQVHVCCWGLALGTLRVMPGAQHPPGTAGSTLLLPGHQASEGASPA